MARDWDGTDDIIDFTLNANQTSLNTITIASWFYADSTAQFKGLFDREYI